MASRNDDIRRLDKLRAAAALGGVDITSHLSEVDVLSAAIAAVRVRSFDRAATVQALAGAAVKDVSKLGAAMDKAALQLATAEARFALNGPVVAALESRLTSATLAAVDSGFAALAPAAESAADGLRAAVRAHPGLDFTDSSEVLRSGAASVWGEVDAALTLLTTVGAAAPYEDRRPPRELALVAVFDLSAGGPIAEVLGASAERAIRRMTLGGPDVADLGPEPSARQVLLAAAATDWPIALADADQLDARLGTLDLALTLRGPNGAVRLA